MLSPQPSVSGSGPQSAYAAVQGWTGEDIANLCHSPDLLAIHQSWVTLSTGKLPRLSEVMANEHFATLANAALLLKMPNDLMFVHYGAAMTKLTGRQFTGVLHSEISGLVAEEIRPLYWQCLDQVEPVYMRYLSQHSQQHFCIEQIALPLAVDERREGGFIYVRAAPMDDKIAVLKAIFDRSPIGMIATTATYGKDGRPRDGRVVLINAHARKLLKLPDGMEGRIQSVRDLGPWFRDGALWTRTNVIAQGQQTHIHYRDSVTDMSYRVTIEPLDTYMLFSIIEAA